MPRKAATALAIVAAFLAAADVFAQVNVPRRFSANVDRDLVEFVNYVDGRTWSVWSYKSGAEYDIAVSLKNPDGSWGEPSFLGSDDSRSEVQPALATDTNGTLYMAFAVRETGQIMLTTLRVNSLTWSTPRRAVFAAGRHAAPSVIALSSQVVVAYRTGQRVGMALMPVVGFGPYGINDGPDGLPPTGQGESNDNPFGQEQGQN